MLANAFATAGAELMEYMGVSSALAAIPNTEPPQYVVAGTLQMIAKVLPKGSAAERPTGDLTDEQINEMYEEATSYQLVDEDYAGVRLFVRAIERAAIAAHLERQAQAEPATSALKRERDRFERMFVAACEALGAINEALGLDPDDGGAEPILAAIEELKAQAAPASQEGAHAAQWISVAERMPAIGEEVLIWCGYRICGYRSDDKHDPENHEGWVIDFDNGNAKSITHWMPLPAAPDLKTPASAERSGDHE